MRLFTSDTPPGIAVPAGNLPRPWVMPAGASPSDRRKLASLLAGALRPFEPDLWLVEVPWVERDALAQGGVRLSPSSLVWWQVERYTPDSVETILAEGSRIAPGFCLFDFAENIDVPAEAWLGPLKMAVLHRLLDRLLDERPIAAHERLAEALGDLARQIVSPVDLMNAADLLVARALRGIDPATVTKEVLAIVLSRRSGASGHDQDVLRYAARLSVDRDQHEGEMGLRNPALEPMLRWIDDPVVASRVVGLLGKRAGMAPPVVSLAERMVAGPASLQLPASLTAPEAGEEEEPREKEPGPEIQATALRQAVYKSIAGDKLGAADTLLSAVRRHEDARWTEEERRAAAHLLLDGALARAGAEDGATIEHAAALAEAAADCAVAPKESPTMVRALVVAAARRLELGQRSAAIDLLARAEPVLDAATAPQLFVLYADVRTRIAPPEHVASELAARLLGLIQSSAKQLKPRTKVLAGLTLGVLHGFAGRDDAEQILERVQVAASQEKLRDLEARAWFGIGHLAVTNDDLRKAARAFEAAVALFRSVPAKVGLPDALYRLGLVAVARDELVRAQEAFEDAQDTYARAGNLVGEARALAALADTLVRQYRMKKGRADDRTEDSQRLEAEAAYERAISIVRSLGDERWLAELLIASAWSQGDAEKSRQLFDEARRLFEEFGDTFRQAQATEQLAQGYWDAPPAQPLFKEASRLYLQAGSPEQAGRVLVLAGLMAKAGGDPAAARSAYAEAARVAPGTEIAERAQQYLQEMDQPVSQEERSA